MRNFAASSLSTLSSAGFSLDHILVSSTLQARSSKSSASVSRVAACLDLRPGIDLLGWLGSSSFFIVILALTSTTSIWGAVYGCHLRLPRPSLSGKGTSDALNDAGGLARGSGGWLLASVAGLAGCRLGILYPGARGCEHTTVAVAVFLGVLEEVLGRGSTVTRLVFLVMGSKGPKVVLAGQPIFSLNSGSWSLDTM